MSTNRSKSVLLRMTPEQHNQLHAEATAVGMSVNAYVLHKTIGAEATPATPQVTRYATLANRVETLEQRLAGLDGKISDAQAQLGRKER